MRMRRGAGKQDRRPDRGPGGSRHPGWGLKPGDEIAPGRSILSYLGGGVAFEVFLVWDDHKLTTLVAKILRPNRAENPTSLRRLRREAAALEQLAHPVIVRGFGADIEGRYPHVLLEHLEGPSLRHLVESYGELPSEQLLPLGLSVATALHYIEQEGLVHLDVKPDNIIMGVPPRLIDLSLMRTIERAQGLTAVIGTDAYMPPEQCVPERMPGIIGPPSDVWGLGATLHYALTGAVPFPRADGAHSSEDPDARFPQLTHAPQPLPRLTPAAVADLLMRMLAPEPGARPTAAAVVDVLEPIVAGAPRRPGLSRSGPQLM